MRLGTYVIAVTTALIVSVAVVQTHASYIAGVGADNSIHFLNANFASTGSFAAGAASIGGVTTNGSLIWSAHFGVNHTVIAHNLSGVQQFSWSNAILFSVQGLTYISSSEIAAASGNQIFFLDPFNGDLVRQHASQEQGTIRGLAYDGAGIIYQLGSETIYATDVTDGSVLYTIVNPAIDDFGGTALAYNFHKDVLAIGSTNGNWYEIDPLNGAILASGNNGLNMNGLAFIPSPGALAVIALAGLIGVRRRRS